MKYCSKCGSELQEGASFCTSCGSKVGVENKVEETTSKVEKQGKSIASMVLGIISVVWAFFVLLALDSVGPQVEGYTIAEIVGFFIGFNFISLPCGIIGLSLGLVSKAKNKKRMAGIITSTISLVVAFISLVVILVQAM